ncbi:MAG: hypothetical protein IJR00_00610 [Lachnospiraceae bacterium]|nr:hypothetical protein [Lachnospiraceae bacterium]
MHPYVKKMIAPLAITCLTVILYSVYIVLAIRYAFPTLLQVAVTVGALAMIGGMIYICYTRYKEIMSGEEDDLDKY